VEFHYCEMSAQDVSLERDGVARVPVLIKARIDGNPLRLQCALVTPELKQLNSSHVVAGFKSDLEIELR
jgi:hypothetical protein